MSLPMLLKVVKRKTPHPCTGLTPAQRRDFELIAIGQRPRGGWKTIQALIKRGLVEQGPPEVVGQDRFGDIKVTTYNVPLNIHAQWFASDARRNTQTDQ